jgi:hypothetical protein
MEVEVSLREGGEITHGPTLKNLAEDRRVRGRRNTTFINDEQTGNLDKLAFSTDC